MKFRGTSLLRRDESRTHPNCISAHIQGHAQSAPVEDTACRHYRNWLASQWGHFAATLIDNIWNQDRGSNVACVASSFSTLCTNDVNASILCLCHMLRMTNHIHDGNS